jgi:hypothetical protein
VNLNFQGGENEKIPVHRSVGDGARVRFVGLSGSRTRVHSHLQGAPESQLLARVTGGSTGIGSVFVLRLADENARVMQPHA